MQLCLNMEQIRELDVSELKLVSGGIFGTGYGGMFGPANIAAAGRLVSGLGFLGGSFSLGFAIGSFGYSTYTRYKYNTQ